MKKILLTIVLFCAFCFFNQQSKAQSVSVSPSRLYYKVGLGEYKSKKITVTNKGKIKQSFQIKLADFESPGKLGKTRLLKPGESEHSCAKWLSASPSFFELGPGETKNVEVLLQIPNIPEANKVKWAVMMIKLAKEKKVPDNLDNKTMGMGIISTFQFAIHIFQTPPSVIFKKAEILSFKEITTDKDSVRILALLIVNTGEDIVDCASYLELTNLENGETKD